MEDNVIIRPNVSNDNKEVVLITGSSGLLGSAIVKRLAGKYKLVGLDRDGPPYPPIEAECIPMNITSRESVTRAMARVKYEYGAKLASVIHLAAFYDFSGKPSNLYEEITVKGTERLLTALQDFEVGQFIFSSTNLIYKPSAPGRKINEDCPVAPNWDYPESKIDTEKLIQVRKGKMNVVILRIAGIYDDWCHSIPISHQIQRIYERQLTSHFYSGDVSHGNVFLHLDDMTDALELSVEKRHSLPSNIAINIGEPETPSYQELQQTIGFLIHGEEWKTYEIPKQLAKVGAWSMDLFGDPFIKPWMIDRADDHYELDITRANTLLNWNPRYKLMNSLHVMINNLKSNPLLWYKENNLDPPGWLEREYKKEHQLEEQF
jgi:nucleoside-diphosphate-sugar epimerase